MEPELLGSGGIAAARLRPPARAAELYGAPTTTAAAQLPGAAARARLQPAGAAKLHRSSSKAAAEFHGSETDGAAQLHGSQADAAAEFHGSQADGAPQLYASATQRKRRRRPRGSWPGALALVHSLAADHGPHNRQVFNLLHGRRK